MTMKENLFVIFAPGLAGNHLSNLISLSPKFYRDCDLSFYQPGMCNAHVASLKNLNLDIILQQKEALLQNNNVLCGHIAEYLWLKDNQLNLLFENRKFVTIGFPAKGSKAYERLVKLKPYYLDDYLFHEQSTLYSQKNLELLFDEHDFFYLSSEDIFTESVGSIVGFVIDQLCTDIDQIRAQNLHDIWFSGIKG